MLRRPRTSLSSASLSTTTVSWTLFSHARDRRVKADPLVCRFLPFSASIFLVNVDNVGSNQMHQIRQTLRGKATILMGKNTMVRRALRTILAEYPQFEKLLPHVKGNIGFVFTAGDLKEVRSSILANVVAAPAKAGAYAPTDVFVPAGNTGMEPGKTSFFQALSIPTKIARGTIEIVSDVQVVTAGTRVGTSEATLLNMLNVGHLPANRGFRGSSC